MNKHEVIARSCRDALEGKTVLLAFPTVSVAREAFAAFKEVELEGIDRKFRNTNGAKQVDFPQTGGRIYFRGIKGQGHRGMSVDSIYLPAEVSDEFKLDVSICLATSKTPKLEHFNAE